jgi:hypothetical protein
MEFTKSTMLAIDFLLRQILRPRYESNWPEPCWCNFNWFHKIQPKKIRQVDYLENDDIVVVERDIEFYLLRDRVAVITMRGIRPAEAGRGDSKTAWSVCRLRYNTHWDMGIRGEWVDRKFDPPSYIWFAIAQDLEAAAK